MQSSIGSNVGAVYLFVYGTLKTGHINHALLRTSSAVYICEAKTEASCTLINLGLYPGLITSGNTEVKGEIWYVDAALLERLDTFENVSNGLFTRKSIAVQEFVPNVQSYVWHFNGCSEHATKGDYQGEFPTISSGNWDDACGGL